MIEDDRPTPEVDRSRESRRDLFWLVLLAAVAAAMIGVALAIGGGVAGD